MKKIVIAGLLTLIEIASLAQSDSTKLYPIEKWRLDRLLHVYFYVQPACDTTVTKLQTALDSLKLSLQTHVKYTEIIIQERNNKALEAETWRQKETNKDQIHKQELKTSRNKGRKEGAIGAGGIGLILLVLAL